MLIAFTINAKLQEHRILHNKRPTFCACTKKEQSVEKKQEEKQSGEPKSTCLMPAESARTYVLAHTLWVGVFLYACVYVCLVDFPSERVVIPHPLAHCVCFFSLTPDSPTRCDPTLLFDWPETVNLKTRKEDWVGGGSSY